ncbi:MAG TPA: hypothetical protein VLH77_02620 [Gammaproteobacteria bacterium]|nr:hypothetical protein [Gammaproteobacteria bacterium]
MLQIEGNTRWARFLTAVKSLDLRFSHAEIVKKTGYSKSVVSAYLNPDGGKEPSENFIRTFCDSFNIDFDLIWSGSSEEKPERGQLAVSTELAELPEQTVGKLAQALADQAEANKIQAAANDKYADGFRALAIILERMESKMARQESQAIIEANLQEVLAGVETIADRQGDAIKQILSDLSELKEKKNAPSKG